MNECTNWLRRSVGVAVWLVAAGLQGCGSPDAWQEDSAPDVGQAAPAHDDFRYAHVLASGYQLSEDVMTSSSADPSSGSAPEQLQEADNEPDTQETDSGKKLAGYGTSLLSSASTDSSSGWTPNQFVTAYGINLIDTAGNRPRGYGTKVAIIVPYHYAQLQNDLAKFAARYSLRPITLNIINQAGNVSKNAWALEAGLSVQMVNIVSPGASIDVIEAKSESQRDIRTAMATAQNLGAHVVLMPFGADETGSQDYGPPFAPAPGMVWIAPSGDSSRPSFPATHPGVIAVGATSARLNQDNTLHSEAAWASAGAGMSIVAEMPDYQMIPSVQEANTTAYRSVPDVAFHADPENGAQIYSSVNGGYVVVGGTSLSAAFFTGVVAIAMTSRRDQNKSSLTSIPGEGVLLQDSLYRLMSTNGGPTNSTVLNDVVDGYAGEGAYPAGPGYDIATGLGSLKVGKFIDYMATQP